MARPHTASTSLSAPRAALRALADPSRAIAVAAYFKTGPGEYGEGDEFLGVRVPDLRKLSREHRGLALADVSKLLRSKLHEERLLALFVLVLQYEKGDAAARKERFEFYLEHLAHVNNWDLVDSSASQIVGAQLVVSGDRKLLRKLAKSKVVWERRVAMIATGAFIRAGESATTFEIAELLLEDKHDLIHKAVGWMLRELGERVGEDKLRTFLDRHAATMPRTALRYAIEKLSDEERKRWMGGAKKR